MNTEEINNNNPTPPETNTEQTPPKRHLMQGSLSNPGFAAQQPTSAQKKAGWAKKKALKTLLRTTNPGKLGTGTFDYAQMTADFFKIPLLDVTVKDMMEFRQIERAISKGDTSAYIAIMDRAYGKPPQALTGAGGTPLVPSEHKIVHVHSDVPLANNEDDVQV